MEDHLPGYRPAGSERNPFIHRVRRHHLARSARSRRVTWRATNRSFEEERHEQEVIQAPVTDCALRDSVRSNRGGRPKRHRGHGAGLERWCAAWSHGRSDEPSPHRTCAHGRDGRTGALPDHRSAAGHIHGRIYASRLQHHPTGRYSVAGQLYRAGRRAGFKSARSRKPLS